jgi:hypothetical protein
MDVPNLSSTLVLGHVSVQLQIANGAAPNDAAALMKPAENTLLQKWPVSMRVNSSRADGRCGQFAKALRLLPRGDAMAYSLSW